MPFRQEGCEFRMVDAAHLENTAKKDDHLIIPQCNDAELTLVNTKDSWRPVNVVSMA